MCFFKLCNRNFMFFTHLKLFLVWNAFGTVMKKPCSLCIFEVISMDHRQGCAGIHHAKGMCISVFIKIFCQFLLHFYEIIICHLYVISLCRSQIRYHLKRMIDLILLNIIYDCIRHIIADTLVFLMPLTQKLTGNVDIERLQSDKTSSILL